MIRNCHVDGTIISNYNSGGIAASSTWGHIFYSTFTGIVKTIDEKTISSQGGAGGIVGMYAVSEAHGLIRNCKVTGTIISNRYAGGIAGFSNTRDQNLSSDFYGYVQGGNGSGIIIGNHKN